MSATKHRIAEVFESHVSRLGYDKANLDDVAREMHISKKTIYVHFDSKQAIYEYVVERQAVREKRKLAAAVADLPTYSARVEAVVRFVLGSARAHILETGRGEWLREYEIAADAFRKANGDLMRELIEAGMAAGEFEAGDAHLVQEMIAAMVVEYLLIVNADPTYDRDDELLARIRRFIG